MSDHATDWAALAPAVPLGAPATDRQRSDLFTLLAATDWHEARIANWLRKHYGVAAVYALTGAQAARAIRDLIARLAEEVADAA